MRQQHRAEKMHFRICMFAPRTAPRTFFSLHAAAGLPTMWPAAGQKISSGTLRLRHEIDQALVNASVLTAS
jgi:hypothetical protein